MTMSTTEALLGGGLNPAMSNTGGLFGAPQAQPLAGTAPQQPATNAFGLTNVTPTGTAQTPGMVPLSTINQGLNLNQSIFGVAQPQLTGATISPATNIQNFNGGLFHPSNNLLAGFSGPFNGFNLANPAATQPLQNQTLTGLTNGLGSASGLNLNSLLGNLDINALMQTLFGSLIQQLARSANSLVADDIPPTDTGIGLADFGMNNIGLGGLEDTAPVGNATQEEAPPVAEEETPSPAARRVVEEPAPRRDNTISEDKAPEPAPVAPSGFNFAEPTAPAPAVPVDAKPATPAPAAPAAPVDAKPATPAPAAPVDAKPATPAPAPAKPADTKPATPAPAAPAKPADAKPATPTPAPAKPADTKPATPAPAAPAKPADTAPKK
jgi:hypothetical protein